MLKQQILASWQERAEDNRQEIARLEAKLAGLRYEQEIARRLQTKASDQETRDTWRIQADVQETLIAIEADDLERRQEYLLVCQGMIAEIEADIVQNGA